jgi:hypothetical protein
MPETLKAVSEIITAAKSSPLALMALVVLLATWVIVTLQVKKSAVALKHLSDVPEKDRLKALEVAMGSVPMKAKLSPEQWLRNRVYQLGFFAFALVCLVVLLLVAMAQYGKQEELKSGISISLRQPEAPQDEPVDPPPGKPLKKEPVEASGTTPTLRQVKAAEPWGVRQMAEDDMPADRVVSYEDRLEDGMEHIRYRASYLQTAGAGGPVSGYNPLGATFKWRFPQLAIDIVNNSKSTMVLSKAILTIERSTVDATPVLMVEDDSVNKLIIRNEGWGDVGAGEVELSIQEILPEGAMSLFAPTTTKVSFASFADMLSINLPPLLPARLLDAGRVAVTGTIRYTASGVQRAIRFATRVSLQVHAAAGIPATHSYQTYFDAGQAPAQISVDIAQQIAPGDADRFYVQLATDKTSHNTVRVDFKTPGGETIPGGRFLLDIFVPRSHGGEQ